ncbi:MAG: tryptophan--tRNA ligase [Armatimonadota bacterium]
MSKLVFSGIQPTGLVHIGNYLGAIKQWVELQHEHESIFSIVDYHAITIPYEPAEMQKNIFEAAVINIAAGLDPNKSIIFVQSHVPEHTELTWILNTITPMGRLSHMTQFKEKSRVFTEGVSAGLFNYPVLMAADILLYKATIVPVGEDQIQHIELTRDIARKFNVTFGETFPEVEPQLSAAPRVMALSDPLKKMSKSIPDSYIALSDPPQKIRKQLMRAVTDAGPEPGAPIGPGIANLFMMMREFSPPETYRDFMSRYEAGTIHYSEMKAALAEDVIRELAPIREAHDELASKPDYIHDVLRTGADKAKAIAARTMAEVKLRMGLI